MSDKETLLKEAQDGYLELQQSIAGLDEARAGEPWLGTWGVREILIHVSGWLLEMTPALERIGRGEAPYPEGVSYDDFDAWNAKFVEARRGVKLYDVVAELEASNREFVAEAPARPTRAHRHRRSPRSSSSCASISKAKRRIFATSSLT